MKDYIDREALIETLRFNYKPMLQTGSIADVFCNAIERTINELPAADVAPVVHGEWLVTKTERGWNCSEYPIEFTCSVCGRTEPEKEPYCHCGAKMDGGIPDGKK